MKEVKSESAKSGKSCELAEIRRTLAEIDKLRFAKGLSLAETGRLESASVDLRNREREIISAMGEEVAAKIKASSVSLEELVKSIKVRTKKISGLPKGLDKTSDVILEVIDILRRVGREL